MQFKDLAEQLSKTSPVPLSSGVVERLGKKDREIKTFVLLAEMNPPRALYRKNLRVEPAAFLSSEVPPRVMQSIQGNIAGL